MTKLVTRLSELYTMIIFYWSSWSSQELIWTMQLPQLESSIFTVDYEITLSTHIISYPLLEDFLVKLELLELHRGWTIKFLIPLRRMGVRALDDMELVTLESLHVFFQLPPIAIMDFFAHVHDTIEHIDCGYPRYVFHEVVATPFVSLDWITVSVVTWRSEVLLLVSCTKHVWYSEHETYYWFKFILERAMSATHVAVILRMRTSPAYEEEFMKKNYPDVRNGYGTS